MNTDGWRRILDEAISISDNMQNYTVGAKLGRQIDMDAHGQNWMCCTVGAKLMADFDLPYVADPTSVDNDTQVGISEYLTQDAFDKGIEFYHAIESRHYKHARGIFESIQDLKPDQVIKDKSYIPDLKKAFTDNA